MIIGPLVHALPAEMLIFERVGAPPNIHFGDTFATDWFDSTTPAGPFKIFDPNAPNTPAAQLSEDNAGFPQSQHLSRRAGVYYLDLHAAIHVTGWSTQVNQFVTSSVIEVWGGGPPALGEALTTAAGDFLIDYMLVHADYVDAAALTVRPSPPSQRRVRINARFFQVRITVGTAGNGNLTLARFAVMAYLRSV